MQELSQPALLGVLYEQLTALQARDQAQAATNQQEPYVAIPNTGKVLTGVYEQLRNSAEYTEEHLLLQHAIRRFYARELFLAEQPRTQDIGQELVIELTHAGYLQRDSVSMATAEQLSRMADEAMRRYGQLRQSHVRREDASEWLLSVLAVESDGLLNPNRLGHAVASVAFLHFLRLFPREQYAPAIPREEYELSLFMAIYLALLKTDVATARTELLRAQPNHADISTKEYIALNRMVDAAAKADLTARFRRVVIKQGAPLRIVYAMTKDRPDLPALLSSREHFMDAYSDQVAREYSGIKRHIGKGIIKSIVFLFVTKVIIGIGIEIPYDILLHGRIEYLPLVINTLTPPAYMALLGLGLTAPARSSAAELRRYIENVLFGDAQPQRYTRLYPKRMSPLGTIVFGTMLMLPLFITIFILNQLGFNIMQMIIFFVFLSTASFLGFRLSGMIRELELTAPQTGLFGSLRNFFYLPFIQAGQWLSGKYARLNIVGRILDIAIELPLKTLLRLVRQWVRFVNEKREDIY
ncbi:hypothetical protein CR970_04050 [Candidatus Saccharibacteria bacterium]|nr:MAG: hypothetical protein CR970_04050 [Candidatus Saccharibacteria bacterium]